MKFDLIPSVIEEDKPRCVVRLKTGYWSDQRGIHIKQDIIFQKRKSTSYSILEEDVCSIGAMEVVNRIINLHTYADGLYEVVVRNEVLDWETGAVDDYEYGLIPFTE